MSTIAVLSLYRPRVEDFLAARGEDIIAVIPESMRERRESADPGYPISTIEHWDDYTTLARLAMEFEALGVTAVATIDEPCVRAAAFIRDLLGMPGQNHQSAVACTDKSMMKKRLGAAGLPVAQHRVVHTVEQIREFLDETGSDVVVKPRYGFGAINTYRVSRDNFDRLVSMGAFGPPTTLPDVYQSTTLAADIGQVGYLVERYVDVAAEYHCELLRHEGSEVHCLAARYFTPCLADRAVGSAFLDPNSDEAIEVRELTRSAATALGVAQGFGHCEIFRDRSGRWLVGEFGARPGGLLAPRMLQLSYGIDNLAMLADQLAGKRPRIDPSARAAGAIAWAAVPVPGSGLITEMPDEAHLLTLPGVIEAHVGLRRGDSTAGLYGTITHAAYVVCRGDTPEHAEALAKDARRACQIRVEPGSVTPNVATGALTGTH